MHKVRCCIAILLLECVDYGFDDVNANVSRAERKKLLAYAKVSATEVDKH